VDGQQLRLVGRLRRDDRDLVERYLYPSGGARA